MRRGLFAAVLVIVCGCSSDPKKPSNNGGGGNTKLAPEPDKRDFLQAAPLAGWPAGGAGLKAGFWVEEMNVTAGKSAVRRLAVVAEAGDLLKIEKSATDDSYQGFIEGLTVQRADGKITEAVAARKGEKPKPIKIGGASPEASAPAPPGTDEQVTVPAGTFATVKTVVSSTLSEVTTWTGKEGDVAGIVVKWSDDNGLSRELKSIETVTGLRVRDDKRELVALHAVYSDGSEEFWVQHLELPFHGQGAMTCVLKIRGGTTTGLTWGEDAKPEIDWTP
jgi:hypothetical protein